MEPTLYYLQELLYGATDSKEVAVFLLPLHQVSAGKGQVVGYWGKFLLPQPYRAYLHVNLHKPKLNAPWPRMH